MPSVLAMLSAQCSVLLYFTVPWFMMRVLMTSTGDVAIAAAAPARNVKKQSQSQQQAEQQSQHSHGADAIKRRCHNTIPATTEAPACAGRPSSQILRFSSHCLMWSYVPTFNNTETHQ